MRRTRRATRAHRWLTLAALVLATTGACRRDSPPPGSATATRERVYVTNTGARSISVIDPAARVVVATIALGHRPHGEAAAPDGRRLYVTTSGGHGEVIAIDTATNTIAWRLDVGARLHQPALTRDGRSLFVPDFHAGVVAVLDVTARRLEPAIPIRGPDGTPLDGLHNAYAGASGHYIYQTALAGRALARIDVAGRAVDRVYPLDGEPRPAALLPDESKIYLQLTRLHGFVEVDLRSGAETRRVAWPEPTGVAPGRTRCHGLGITPDGRELWAASNLEDDVRLYALPELAELARIPVGDEPDWIAFSPDGSTAYVTNVEPDRPHGSVSVVDRAARSVVATITVGRQPKRIRAVMVPAAPG
jgi:YVTN family beta-propeller protein